MTVSMISMCLADYLHDEYKSVQKAIKHLESTHPDVLYDEFVESEYVKCEHSYKDEWASYVAEAKQILLNLEGIAWTYPI